MEKATLADRDWGVKASRRVRAIVVNEQLGRHLPSLDAAIQENGRILGETLRAREVQQHLRALRAEAAMARLRLSDVAPVPSRSMSLGP